MIIHQETLKTSVGPVVKVTLTTERKLRLTLLSYAASIYDINLNGQTLTVSPTDIETFIKTNMNYGKTIGRMSGRTSIKPFVIGSETYQLVSNINSQYQLHGGYQGFSKQNFELVELNDYHSHAQAIFHMISPDMAEGFPGEIDLYVVYTLYENNQLDIEFKATSTKDTYLNITNHTYFNLLGRNNQVLSHQLQIPATSYLKRHDNFDFIDVVPLNDAFDFTKDRTLGEAIKANMDQGFDDTLFIDSKKELVLTEPTSPYQIKFKTTYPAVVIYTHNLKSQALIDDYPDGGLHSGIAIECQYAPGGIHEPKIKMPLLKKGALYHHKTALSFEEKSTI